MSKILRRPMFRGGRVDSRGTGITSGLIDRPGLQSGGTPTGAEIKAMAEKNIFGVPALRDLNRSTNFINDLGFNYGIRPLGNLANMGTNYILGTDIPMIQKRDSNKPFEDILQKEATRLSNELIPQVDEEDEYEEGYSDITEKNQTKKRQETENKELQKKLNPNDPNNNNEQKVEMSAKDLIAENAELFKELLGEGDKKKLKDARISDASDYLLKFFEGSQKEGATVGSAAADVAGFATAKDSRTEKAIAANEKVDQTATVLAINDYISGKRSKEQIQEALSLAAAKVSLSAGTLGDKILKAKGSGPVTVTVIRDVLRSEPEFKNKTIEEFDSTKADLTYSAGDENKIFIDAITKNTFTFDANKNKIKIY